MRLLFSVPLLFGGAFFVATSACSGASVAPDNSTSVDGAAPTDATANPSTDSGWTAPRDASSSLPDAQPEAASPRPDAAAPYDAAPSYDASTPPPPTDAGLGDSGDGPPTRKACTGSFGTGLSTTHGRLDGYIVSIVGLGGSGTCNGDSTHVHLQIAMNGAVYDVAVNADTLVAERDQDLPDGAWLEGWHTSDALDYAALGLHSNDFKAAASVAANAQQIESTLASANHVSVFATGYGPSGAHLVHRQSGGRDGAIVINPLGSPAHLMMFTFTTSTPF